MLRTQLLDYIHAAFPGLWIETLEPEEAEREIRELATSQGWTCAAWDISRGLRTSAGTAEATDPLSVLRSLPALAEPDGTALLILHHFHRFLGNIELVQTLLSELQAGKQRRTFVIVLAPTVQLPLELEKAFVILEHPLPDRGQLGQIAQELLRHGVAVRP